MSPASGVVISVVTPARPKPAASAQAAAAAMRSARSQAGSRSPIRKAPQVPRYWLSSSAWPSSFADPE